jgi:hypothetical protein
MRRVKNNVGGERIIGNAASDKGQNQVFMVANRISEANSGPDFGG